MLEVHSSGTMPLGGVRGFGNTFLVFSENWKCLSEAPKVSLQVGVVKNGRGLLGLRLLKNIVALSDICLS